MEVGAIITIRLFRYNSFRHYGGRSITPIPYMCKAKFLEQQRDHSFLCELQEPCIGFPIGHKIAVPSAILTSKKMLEGWHHPTLAYHYGQWVIWSDEGKSFVPLEKAIPALVAACPGAWEKLEELDSEPF